ncbi:MarR family transcriptional regulator [Hellea sp.]|nr:MarR family transcriptional regulator [Hellea sp.]
MTEITKITELEKLDNLPEAVQRFILHWGDMGTTWGVNRTVAQIHALLFIMEQPLNAEQITDCLGVARSNVSNSLKELLGFKTIRRVPVAGDRRDYFTAETDVWEVAKRIATVRKAREIDPALETLTYCLKVAKGDKGVSDEQRKRLQDMQDFTATMDRWYGQMQTLPTSTLTKLIGMGDRVVGLLNIGRKKN